jgi:cytochrome P450
MSGQRAKTIESLHLKHGPVVQIGPTEVSFNSIPAIDILYGSQSKFIKAPWYDSLAREGVFKIRPLAAHHHRRKMMSRAFSPASAYELEPNVSTLLQKFISIVEKRWQSGALDMRHWFRMLAFDFSGMAFVGAPFGGLQTDDDGIPRFLSDMEHSMLVWDLEGRFPFLMWLIKQIPVPSLSHFFNCADRLYEFSDRIFAEYMNTHGRSSGRKDIVAKLVRKNPESKEGLADYQLSCDIANLTLAATDTSSIVLTYLFWELALNMNVQERLRAELKEGASIDSKTGIPAHQSLVNLKYLNATINETMRLHSPIPMGLLRQAPPGGSTIEGYFIPAEVRHNVPISLSL